MDSILPFGGDGALGVVLDDAEAGGRRDALRWCEEDGHSGAGEGEAEQYAEFCRFVSPLREAEQFPLCALSPFAFCIGALGV